MAKKKQQQKKERAERLARLAVLETPRAEDAPDDARVRERRRAAGESAPSRPAWVGAVSLPAGKEKISLRVDADILAWFRGLGPRYQTHMNAVLRAYYEQERRRGPSLPA